MNNDKLKQCLDDAASGIREDPWLLQKVLWRAKNGEETQMRKKVSAGTILIALTIVWLMSIGIAAVSNWTVLDFLKDWEEEDATFITTTVQQESETENARLKVESAVYDGTKVAFDLTLENKSPEVPMWCWVERLTVNGEACEPGVVYVPASSGVENGLLYSVSSGFEDQWLPNERYPDGIAQCGEMIDLSLIHADGKDTAHVEMRVKVYRPIRPVALIDMQGSFREELEQKISEGYYPIPGYKWNHILYPDGQFCPEEDLSVCPAGWSIAVSGHPDEEDDMMGGMTVETLEIRFDAHKTELVEDIVHLQPQESYENEYCTAVFEEADISSLGLCLTLRVKPKNDQCETRRTCLLMDGEGNMLEGSKFFPDKRERYDSPDHEGEMIWKFRWKTLRLEDLPDTIVMACTLDNGEKLSFPVKVR